MRNLSTQMKLFMRVVRMVLPSWWYASQVQSVLPNRPSTPTTTSSTSVSLVASRNGK